MVAIFFRNSILGAHGAYTVGLTLDGVAPFQTLSAVVKDLTVE